MVRGTALEPEARKRYEAISKVRMTPACLQSNKHAWQRASVDGLAANGNTVVEIKCGESVYKKTASSRHVPSYYIGQLQHILAVTELPCIDFFCWLPGLQGIHLRVERDDPYIARLIVTEQAFWQQLIMQKGSNNAQQGALSDLGMAPCGVFIYYIRPRCICVVHGAGRV